jgi:hypothetical protein
MLGAIYKMAQETTYAGASTPIAFKVGFVVPRNACINGLVPAKRLQARLISCYYRLFLYLI